MVVKLSLDNVYNIFIHFNQGRNSLRIKVGKSLRGKDMIPWYSIIHPVQSEAIKIKG